MGLSNDDILKKIAKYQKGRKKRKAMRRRKKEERAAHILNNMVDTRKDNAKKMLQGSVLGKAQDCVYRSIDKLLNEALREPELNFRKMCICTKNFGKTRYVPRMKLSIFSCNEENVEHLWIDQHGKLFVMVPIGNDCYHEAPCIPEAVLDFNKDHEPSIKFRVALIGKPPKTCQETCDEYQKMALLYPWGGKEIKLMVKEAMEK